MKIIEFCKKLFNPGPSLCPKLLEKRWYVGELDLKTLPNDAIFKCSRGRVGWFPGPEFWSAVHDEMQARRENSTPDRP